MMPVDVLAMASGLISAFGRKLPPPAPVREAAGDPLPIAHLDGSSDRSEQVRCAVSCADLEVLGERALAVPSVSGRVGYPFGFDLSRNETPNDRLRFMALPTQR